MDKLFTRLFLRYGTQVTIGDGVSKQAVKGIFFSVNSRSWQNMQRVYVPLGEVPRGQYICVLPAYVDVQTGYTVTESGKCYEIRRAETVRSCNQPVYYWCLCVEQGEADQW